MICVNERILEVIYMIRLSNRKLNTGFISSLSRQNMLPFSKLFGKVMLEVFLPFDPRNAKPS